MFVNMFLLSLLTIIYGTKGDEGGGSGTVEKNVMNFLSESQQRGDGKCKYANIYVLVCFGDGFCASQAQLEIKIIFSSFRDKTKFSFHETKGEFIGWRIFR